MGMATKNIAIKEEVYKKLLSSKGDGESFSDAIDRLLDQKPSLLSFAGVFKEDDKEALCDGERNSEIKEESNLASVFFVIVLDTSAIIDFTRGKKQASPYYRGRRKKRTDSRGNLGGSL